GADCPIDIEGSPPEPVREFVDRGRIDGSLTHEKLANPKRQPIGSGWVFQQHLDQVGALPLPRSTKQYLLSIVVADGHFLELTFVGSPTSEGASGLLHVHFRVMADAQCEAFHQLPAKVLVRMSLSVGRCVEPHQERWFADSGVEQFTERFAGKLAK